MELSPSTKGCTKQIIVQNAFDLLHQSLHTTILEITHGVLILAFGGSRGHTKDWALTLENGPSPSALRGAVATLEGGLASAVKRKRNEGQDGQSFIVHAPC